MKLLRLELQHWCQHSQSDLKFPDEPIILLSGPNNSGKTTPFYAYDRQKITERIALLRRYLPPEILLHYAMKANPMPAVVQHLAGLVDGMDVASVGEMKIALDTILPSGSVSFAGPGKKVHELSSAIAAGVVLNVESAQELELIEQRGESLGITPKVATRVNPDFELKSSGMKMGGGPKPFGVDAERVPDMLMRLDAMGLDFVGFHMFSGSQNLHAAAIGEGHAKTFELAVRLAEHAPSPVRLLNIGGGFGVPYFPGDHALNLAVIGENLQRLMPEIKRQLPDARIAIELGRYMVAEAGIYVCRVLERKLSRGQVFLVTDGGLHHHLAASGNFGQVFRKNYPGIIGNKVQGTEKEIVSIVGPLCKLRAAARAIATQLVAAKQTASFYQQTLLPLRESIVDSTLRKYNAMDTGPAQVLQAKRDQIAAARSYVEVLHVYWVTRAQADLLKAGRLPALAPGGHRAAPTRAAGALDGHCPEAASLGHDARGLGVRLRLAAGRQLGAQEIDGAHGLLEEARRAVDEHALGVAGPGLLDAGVDLRRLAVVFDAQRVAAIVRAVGGHAQVHDRGVARELALPRRLERGEEVRRVARPVRQPVERAAIAQPDADEALLAHHLLDLGLHVVDRALRSSPTRPGARAREASTTADIQATPTPAGAPAEAAPAPAQAATTSAPPTPQRRAHTWGQPPGMLPENHARENAGLARSPSTQPGRRNDSSAGQPNMEVGGYQVYYDTRSETRLRAWRDRGMTEIFIPLPGTRPLMVCPLEIALRRDAGECRLLDPDSRELANIGDAREVINIQQVYRRGELVWRGPGPYR